MTKPKPKAILFDLDGTLADSAHDLIASANLMLQKRNLPLVDIKDLRSQVSKGVRGILLKALNITPEHVDYPNLQQEFLNNYQQKLCEGTVLFDNVIETIQQIKALNIKWGIVTNKAQRFTIPLIQELITKYNFPNPQVIVGGDTASHPKPHPAPILYACEKLNIAPNKQDVWYIGDDLRDIQSANSANILSIAASYGYLGEEENIQNWNADLTINNIKDILNLF